MLAMLAIMGTMQNTNAPAATPCTCKRCALGREILAAREDETLRAHERIELIQDLRADIGNAPRCPRVKCLLVVVGEALRARVTRALEEQAIGPVSWRGYLDGSTTVALAVWTDLAPEAVQRVVWDSPGLGSIWCRVTEAA